MSDDCSNSVFATDLPTLNDDQLNQVLGDCYGISGELARLVSERDQNVKVTSDKGVFVLKISNIAENPDILDLQNSALLHLNNTGMHRLVPEVINGIDGHPIQKVQSEQGQHCVRLVSFLQGELYSEVKKSPDLLFSLGEYLGRLSKSLSSFGHPTAHRSDFLWNLDNAHNCKAYLDHIDNQDNRQLLAELFERYERHVLPKLKSLRCAVVHQDANDNNIIIDSKRQQVTGLIDYGDLCFGRQINELAVAMAYALQGEDDLYGASQQIIKGYVKEFPLLEDELDVLFDLIRMRLVMSVCISSFRTKDYQENDYLLVSQRPAFDLLWRMQEVNPAFMTAVFRKAATYSATKNHQQIVDWLSSADNQPVNMFDVDLKSSPRRVLPLNNIIENARVEHYQDLLTNDDKANSIAYLIGRYAEDRNVYTADQFASVVTPEHRTMHLGLDIFVDAGAALYAPLPGRVYALDDNAIPQGFGPTIMLEHDTGDNDVKFYTLYGHLSHSAFDLLEQGQEVEAGQLIGHIGEYQVNGNWVPHLHFQIMTDMLGLKAGYNGVGEKSLWPVWSEICPDPNLITQLAPESFELLDDSDLLERRQLLLGPSLSISYRNKLNIVRGQGAYLYDHTGRQYLDCVNNICHVGHCHPHVVESLQRQAKVLNTNTRYLHKTILDYAERLTATLPDPLSVVYFVNSGTEANELALRIARTVTGIKNTIVLDWAYHGNSYATVEISPYKFKRKGGFEKPDFVEIAEFPDPYCGQHKGMSEQSGLAYAQSVAECVNNIKQQTGHGPAAFIAESISGVGGQVVYPDGYLKAAYEAVRAEGGLCISDEVQCGFGRVGSHFWAFELQDVIPDVVVLGKPMGNGHPLAAVVTTRELAKRFANGMEYFNSFGGNPVSTAVGMAVMDVIENENLMQNALKTGSYLLNEFNKLMKQSKVIGDVRGKGFFLGLELVKDRETLKPATELASDIVNDLRENGVLFSTDGPYGNVLKFKPPMVLSKDDADYLITELQNSLSRCHYPC